MYWDEHPPPHFHAEYNDFEAQIDIESVAIIRGKLPHGAWLLVKEWAHEHHKELMEDWKLCEQLKQPQKIAPLE